MSADNVLESLLSIIDKYEDPFLNVETKIDRVNSNLLYVGRAEKGSSSSDSVWKIWRVLIQGNVTSIEFATHRFNKVWDDRNSLFPAGVLNNLYSTDFDGVNDYISLGNNHNFEHSTQFSYSLWINPNNLAAFRYFMGKMSQDATVAGLRIGINTNGKINTQARCTGGSFGPDEWPTSLVAGDWYHLVLTWAGNSNKNGQKLYIDGVAEAFTPASGNLPNSWLHTYDFRIGAAPANHYVGNIDEVTIWNKALTASEVTELYNAGTSIDPRTTSMAGNLVSWYRMGDGDAFPTILDQQGVANGTMTNMTSTDFELDVP